MRGNGLRWHRPGDAGSPWQKGESAFRAFQEVVAVALMNWSNAVLVKPGRTSVENADAGGGVSTAIGTGGSMMLEK